MQNFTELAIQRWGSLEQLPKEIESLFAEWNQLQTQINNLNEDKKIRSASIGRLRQSGNDASDEIRQVAELKQTIKDTKSKLKALEKQLHDSLKEEDVESFPPRFLPLTSHAPAPEFTIVRAGLDDTDAIDNFVKASPNSYLYHLSCWRKLICDVFGHNDLTLIAKDNNNCVIGVLPLIHMQSKLFGNFASSLPFFNYGGPVAHHNVVQNALVEKAIHEYRESNIEHIELREITARQGLKEKTEKVSMIRRLPSTVEELDRQLGTKLRAQVKRSQSLNPEFKVGKEELIGDFYKVFSTNMRDLGTPVYNRKFFSEVLRHWYDDTDVIVVYVNKQPISAAILLGYKDCIEIPWASALRSSNKLGINMFMYWNVLSLAIERQYRFFDFGRSSRDSGTFRFKEQWGAKPLQNHWNYWLTDNNNLPEINPNNPKYKLVISIWKRLPVSFTNLVGPMIVKNIP